MQVGIYNRWLDVLGGGERYMLGIARSLAPDHCVHVLSPHHVPASEIEKRLHIETRGIQFNLWPDLPDEKLSAYTQCYDLFINASHMSVLAPQAKSSVLVVYFPAWSGQAWWQPPLSWVARYLLRPALQFKAARTAFERLFSDGVNRVHRIPPPRFQSVLALYDAIWAISYFTRQWIERYWNLPSQVLYPPVDVESFSPLEKQNFILSVGRFFVGGHNKKQLEMVRAFRQMCDEGLKGWELHLVGGTETAQRHRRYLAQVQEEAKGYPICFHLNSSFQELKLLYGQSKIYWHASGSGENVELHPERFEHFGITTVEAMAAGCVPVVINQAGQSEIVTHGETGLLWNTWSECRLLTRQLIDMPQLMDRLSKKAIAHSRQFGMLAFEQTLHKLLGQLGFSKET